MRAGTHGTADATMDAGPRTMITKIQAIPRHQKRFSTRKEHRTNKNNDALIARRDQGIMALTREPLVEGVAMRRELGEPQARVGNNYD